MLSSNLTSQETASKPARHVRSHVSSLSSPLVLGQFPALVPSMQDQPTAAHVVDSSGTTLIRTVEEPDIDLITHTPDIKSATTSTCSGSNLKSSQKLAHPSLVSHSTSNDAESLDRIQTGFASTSLDQLPIEHCSKNDDLDICSPLGFHIPKDKLLDAMFAEPNSPGSYWQHTLYRGPKGNSDNVKVHYCKNKEATERVAQLFLDEEVIGFDIEWKSNSSLSDDITKTVSLIQIASESRIALFHLARYPNSHAVNDFVAPTFKTIMESKDITKVGVAIKGDCTRLRKYLQIESRGTFELSHLYKLVKFSSGDVKKINKTLVSLAQQVREHFRLPLFKGEVRSSDWSQELDYRQVQCK